MEVFFRLDTICSGRDVALIGTSSQSRQMNRKHACFLPILYPCVKGSFAMYVCSRTHWVLVKEVRLLEFPAKSIYQHIGKSLGL